MTKPPSIKDLAEKIWTKEHSQCDYKHPVSWATCSGEEFTKRRDYLNEITRIESILVEFKREIVEAYQGRIEELEDQLATSEASYKELVHEITKARKMAVPLGDVVRPIPHLKAIATEGCQSHTGTVYAPATED